MSNPSRYSKAPSRQRAGRSKRRGRRSPPPPVNLRPAADKRLSASFDRIGIPAPQPFVPDPYQLEAVQAVQTADCLVTAPTGAGKTWIAVEAMRQIHQKGQRAWYASPLKALSNAKYGEFAEAFGSDQVGILTGDRKENPDAPIIIGTTEILRNQLYDVMYRGQTLRTDFVVLDEAHYLGDPERGVVWEEVMIYLPERIPLLLLSATIGNAFQIAGWLAAIRNRECRVVAETQRPVPLKQLFLRPDGTLLPLLTASDSNPQHKPRLDKKIINYISQKSPPWLAPGGKLPPFGQILRLLKKYDLLPAIFFQKSRADCDNALGLCDQIGHLMPVERSTRRQARIDELIAGNDHLAAHRHLWYLRKLGVGAHHSGQLPAWKLILETLMSESLLTAVFATSTVAAGVNFPARTIALQHSDRFNGETFVPLSTTEFQQMTGRAGRRGMDNIGFAVALPGKFMNLPLLGRLATSPPSAVLSQIRINFSMVLNLLLSHSPGEIETLLERSFAAYVRQRTQLANETSRGGAATSQVVQAFRNHVRFLIQNQFVDSQGVLTEDGVWASKLRVDRPLIIAECLRQRLFNPGDPAIMAALVASLVDDRDLREGGRKSAPKGMLNAFLALRKRLRPFAFSMFEAGFEARPIFLKTATAMHAWASGNAWPDVCARGEIAEGNLAMLVMRTCDHLRHLMALTDTFPEVAQAAQKGIALLLREPVTMDLAGLER